MLIFSGSQPAAILKDEKDQFAYSITVQNSESGLAKSSYIDMQESLAHDDVTTHTSPMCERNNTRKGRKLVVEKYGI